MNWIRDFHYYKKLAGQSTDLILLRLQMLQIDIGKQTESLFKLATAFLFGAVLLLLAGVSLLLALHQILPPDTLLWIFYIGGLILLLTAVTWIGTALHRWKQQSHRTGQTLNEIRQDIETLRHAAKRP